MFDCGAPGEIDYPVDGTNRLEACHVVAGVAFPGRDLFDPVRTEPGDLRQVTNDGATTWIGYVYAGRSVMQAAATDRGLARQILDSARVEGADDLDSWHAFEAEGVRFELPIHWDQLDCPAFTHHFGPGSARCGGGEYLTFHPEAVFDPVMAPGEIISGEEDGENLWLAT